MERWSGCLVSEWMAVFQAQTRWVWQGVAELRRREALPSRPLVVAAACLAGGCVVGRVPSPLPGASLAVPWWCLAVVTLAAWAVARRGGWPGAAPLLVGAAIAATGAAWSAARFDLFSHAELAWQLTETPAPVALRGTVVEGFRPLPLPPADRFHGAPRRPSSECVVAVDSLRSGRRWRTATGRAAVIVDGEPPAVEVGCRVRVLGRGLRPAAALNPGEFDFRLKARSSRCLTLVRVREAADVRVLARSTWSPGRWLAAARAWGEEVFRMHLAPERVALASALLLGSREALPREETDDYLVTGTVHILSISGLHVGLLSLALFKFLRVLFVPRVWGLGTVAVLTGLYAILVGAETPVVRATLLVWLGCLAAACGRRAPVINALAVAVIVVLAFRPADVLGIGAQLSFLSTAVIVGAAGICARPRLPPDPIDRLIDRSRPWFERILRRFAAQTGTLFLTGAAVWVATAPLVAARFHVVSPVGLLLNVLVAPLVAAAMGCGFLCLLAAAVSPAVAGWCGAACDLSLALVGGSVARAAELPGGHAWVLGPPSWWVAGWYAGFALLVLTVDPRWLRRPATWMAAASGWIVVGGVGAAVAGCVGRGPEPGLRVVMAALGHGCGIVVRSPAGRCLVYDAGRLGAPGSARRVMEALLWSERITRIDTLVISHADTDHFNAVPQLCERFTVGELVVSAAFRDSPAPAAVDLLALAAARGIPVRITGAGESFALDASCLVRVLHPDGPSPDRPGDRGRPTADNGQSLVLAVEAAGRRLLLTGDLEGEPLQRFVTADPDSCDVLVAPHHGSRTSLPPGIARATAPTLVLCSGPGGPSWPEVQAAYREASPRGPATVLATGLEGAIAVRLSAHGIRVARHTAGAWRDCAQRVAAGRAQQSPATTSANWLTTYPASSISTPLVKP